jgi:hypothetical protein
MFLSELLHHRNTTGYVVAFIIYEAIHPFVRTNLLRTSWAWFGISCHLSGVGSNRQQINAVCLYKHASLIFSFIVMLLQNACHSHAVAMAESLFTSLTFTSDQFSIMTQRKCLAIHCNFAVKSYPLTLIT